MNKWVIVGLVVCALLTPALGAGRRRSTRRAADTEEVEVAPRRANPMPGTQEYLKALNRECLVKQLAYNFSLAVLPERAPLVEAFDALRLATDCGLPRPKSTAPTAMDSTRPFNVYAASGAASASYAQRQRERQQTARGVSLSSIEVHVDYAKGSDSNDGSLSAPLKTIAAGVQATRNRQPGASTATVFLHAGTHYVASPVVLTAADANLTITNYQNDQVVVSGAAPLNNLVWTQSGSYYSADVSKLGVQPFTQLFINGRRAIRARYPNGNPETMGRHTSPTGYTNAAGWTTASGPTPSTEIKISTPTRSPSNFGTFGIGVGGSGCDIYDPQESVWCMASPPAGSHHVVPNSVTVNLPRTWAHPETAIVHAFHSGYWEGWQFSVKSAQAAGNGNVKLNFAKGGFQGGRGSGSGNELYIENVFEELDAPNEWFLDTTTMTLYYYPNDTEWQSAQFEASQLPSVFRMIGSAAEPVVGVTVNGLTFAHTATTFMEAYDVPSGGDWSIHRDGTVYLEGTEDVLIENCLFYSIGSSGVFINAYNRRAHVASSEFVWLAENAVAAFGKVALMDGTTGTQPWETVMEKCLVHEIGVFGKQVSAFAQSLAAHSHVLDNVFFNGPRAAINFNDGFGGGSEVAGNVMYNWVRETSDHGPFNSWDRLPYLVPTKDGTNFTLIPETNTIHHNFFLGNYHTVWPIDHDDGSCFYEDDYNLLAFGGFKNYLGHDKHAMGNLYLFPDMKSITDGVQNKLTDTMGAACVESDSGELTGGQDTWTNNTCVLATSAYAWDFWSCNLSPFQPAGWAPMMSGNQFYTSGASTLGWCGRGSSTFTLEQLQAVGYELGSALHTTMPSDDTLVAWARKLLDF